MGRDRSAAKDGQHHQYPLESRCQIAKSATIPAWSEPSSGRASAWPPYGAKAISKTNGNPRRLNVICAGPANRVSVSSANLDIRPDQGTMLKSPAMTTGPSRLDKISSAALSLSGMPSGHGQGIWIDATQTCSPFKSMGAARTARQLEHCGAAVNGCREASAMPLHAENLHRCWCGNSPRNRSSTLSLCSDTSCNITTSTPAS